MIATARAKARAFLAAYKITGNVAFSAQAAGVEKTIHYRWLRNKFYARAFARARTEFGDMLEAAAIKRAKDGVLEPVFYQGVKCGAIRKYSDGLMMGLLKSFKSEEYVARVSAELSGPGGGPIPITERVLASLTDDELAQLHALAAKLTVTDGDSGGGDAPAAEED